MQEKQKSDDVLGGFIFGFIVTFFIWLFVQSCEAYEYMGVTYEPSENFIIHTIDTLGDSVVKINIKDTLYNQLAYNYIIKSDSTLKKFMLDSLQLFTMKFETAVIDTADTTDSMVYLGMRSSPESQGVIYYVGLITKGDIFSLVSYYVYRSSHSNEKIESVKNERDNWTLPEITIGIIKRQVLSTVLHKLGYDILGRKIGSY